MINVVLFEPEIPVNTGNIMRTCVAANAKLHLIKPLGFKLDEASIKRSGTNYVENCDYQVYENMEDFYSKNEGEYYFLCRYGKKPHTSFDYSDLKQNIYFFFGKESAGIPPSYLKPHIDRVMRMPMSDKVRAMNVSNTVAIMVYEALRQRDYPDLHFQEPHKSPNFIEEN